MQLRRRLRHLGGFGRPQRGRFHEVPYGSLFFVVPGPADQRGRAVGGHRDRATEAGFAFLAGGGDFSAQLRPGRFGACELPDRTDPRFRQAADQGSVPVPRQGNRGAEVAGERFRAFPEQLPALLGPTFPGAGEHIGSPREGIVVGADQEGAAILGQRDRPGKLFAFFSRARQLRPLMDPFTVVADEDPRGASFVVQEAGDGGGRAVGREGNGGAERRAFFGRGQSLSGRPVFPRAGEDVRRGFPLTPISAVLPSPDRATLLPNRDPPRMFRVGRQVTTFLPCCDHFPCERTKTHTAPVWGVSNCPPINAVLPSSESATETPNSAAPTSSAPPVRRLPWWFHSDPVRRTPTPRLCLRCP